MPRTPIRVPSKVVKVAQAESSRVRWTRSAGGQGPSCRMSVTRGSMPAGAAVGSGSGAASRTIFQDASVTRAGPVGVTSKRP